MWLIFNYYDTQVIAQKVSTQKWETYKSYDIDVLILIYKYVRCFASKPDVARSENQT